MNLLLLNTPAAGGKLEQTLEKLIDFGMDAGKGHINRHFNLCNRTFHHQADKRVGSQNTRKAED